MKNRNLADLLVVCPAVLFFLVVVLPAAIEAQPLDADRCYRANFPETNLLWPSSGAWSPDNTEIYVTDEIRREILAISCDGHVDRSLTDFVSAVGSELVAPRSPGAIRRNSDGTYSVQDNGEGRRGYYHFTPGLEWSEHASFNERDVDGKGPAGGPARISRIYDGVEYGPAVLGFADVFDKKQQAWSSSFVLLEGRTSGYRRLGEPVDLESGERILYTLSDLRYVAMTDEAAYVLLFGSATRIGELCSGMADFRRLNDFPQQFASSPRLERNEDWRATGQKNRQMIAFYEEIEKTRMAVGLYTWRQSLFLLAKEAMQPNGETVWHLLRLNPEDGTVLSDAVLPTTAAHLVAIPGDFWAFIERGKIGPFGEGLAPYRKTTSMLLVPSDWITSPAGRLDDTQPNCPLRSQQSPRYIGG